MLHHTHNDFHLGDNLVVLNFLRKLAFANPGHQFRHSVQACHLAQLQSIVVDVPNLFLGDVAIRSKESIDLWKNAGAGTPQGGFWESHPLKEDFVWFHVAWFSNVSRMMGLENPVHRARDLLFDFPALLDTNPLAGEQFDFLVINSQPCSGQLPAYDRVEYFDPLLKRLVEAGHKVACTQKSDIEGVTCTQAYNLSLSEIGRLSIGIPHIVGVATGPMWMTFNIWNQASVKLRLILLEGEQLNLDPEAIQVNTIERATEVLRGRGLLA